MEIKEAEQIRIAARNDWIIQRDNILKSLDAGVVPVKEGRTLKVLQNDRRATFLPLSDQKRKALIENLITLQKKIDGKDSPGRNVGRKINRALNLR